MFKNIKAFTNECEANHATIQVDVMIQGVPKIIGIPEIY